VWNIDGRKRCDVVHATQKPSAFSSKAIYGRLSETGELRMGAARRDELALRQVWLRVSPWREKWQQK
jgi:hypothetical protein